MTKEKIFNYFLTNNANLGVKMIVFTMLAALVIASIIYVTYYNTHKGVAYNKGFNASLIIVLLISVVIMLMISSNIVISLGMVGALSIVRFRTAVRDSRDTIFIFWAITEGLCVVSLNFKLALITTLFISIILIALTNIPKINNKYLIVIIGNNIDNDRIKKILNIYSIHNKIRSNNKSNDSQEIIYEIRVKKELDENIVNELSKVKGIETVNYVIESGETVG